MSTRSCQVSENTGGAPHRRAWLARPRGNAMVTAKLQMARASRPTCIIRPFVYLRAREHPAPVA
eukprot:11219085-Lingulodinium_polyedra.AAC.1